MQLTAEQKKTLGELKKVEADKRVLERRKKDAIKRYDSAEVKRIDTEEATLLAKEAELMTDAKKQGVPLKAVKKKAFHFKLFGFSDVVLLNFLGIAIFTAVIALFNEVVLSPNALANRSSFWYWSTIASFSFITLMAMVAWIAIRREEV